MLIFISQLNSKIWKHSNNSSRVLTDIRKRKKKGEESSLNKEKIDVDLETNDGTKY